MIDKKLYDMYYDLISYDHHKSRDLVFNIEITYKDGEVTYYAYHPGYVNEFGADVGSLEEGWEYLNRELAECVKSEIKSLRSVLAMSPQERRECWLLDPPITYKDLWEYEQYVWRNYG